MLCVPRDGAQQVSGRLVDLGIEGFWNFSHYDQMCIRDSLKDAADGNGGLFVVGHLDAHGGLAGDGGFHTHV